MHVRIGKIESETRVRWEMFAKLYRDGADCHLARLRRAVRSSCLGSSWSREYDHVGGSSWQKGREGLSFEPRHIYVLTVMRKISGCVGIEGWEIENYLPVLDWN